MFKAIGNMMKNPVVQMGVTAATGGAVNPMTMNLASNLLSGDLSLESAVSTQALGNVGIG